MPHSHSLEYHTRKLLAYGERVFKTDLAFLLRGGFWSSVGQVVSSLSALILSIALSRWVPKAAYGEYKYVLALIAVLGAFCLNGVATSVFISTARGFGRALPDGFAASLKWSGLVFLGALGIGGYYIIHGNITIGVGILIGGCLTPFLTSSNLYNSYLAGKKDYRRQSLYGMVGTALPALVILITAYFHPTALAIILSYVLGNTIVTLILYYVTLQKFRAREEPSDPDVVRYAWHQSAMGLLTTIAGNIDNLFLFHYIGAVEVAIYTFAIGVLDQSKGPLKSLDSMVQSRFATQRSQTIRESMNNKIFWLLVTSIVFIIFYIFAAPYIYEILFPNYVTAVSYSQVYAFSLLSICTYPAGSYLNAKKKLTEQYVSTFFNSGIQIFAILFGIFFFGLWGLIWARVVIRIGGGAVTYILYARAVKSEA